ncbi:hypothetical protein DPMN_008796 [Dreissena polymorpha]|uniref:Uncharacterized protein n=1 Tax=Dreissena polymorpha TaxID=45954 RepID=A0A9D4MYG7_DREPO|nr:hypothetical protein DPMN_008796 [Dreissena polymorpha]
MFDEILARTSAALRHLVSGSKYRDMGFGWKYADEVMPLPTTVADWTRIENGFRDSWADIGGHGAASDAQSDLKAAAENADLDLPEPEALPHDTSSANNDDWNIILITTILKPAGLLWVYATELSP